MRTASVQGQPSASVRSVVVRCGRVAAQVEQVQLAAGAEDGGVQQPPVHRTGTDQPPGTYVLAGYN